MRKNDDLTRLGLLNEPSRDALAPFVVQGGNWIVEHDGGTIVGGAKLGKEGGNCKASLFPFADDVW